MKNVNNYPRQGGSVLDAIDRAQNSGYIDNFTSESEMWSLISLCRTWPMKMLRLLLAVLSVWLGIVVLAVLLGVFPDGNGVLHPFH
jgi:hypothetical protein